MINVDELASLNRQILSVIQVYAKENTVFGTATKFGLSMENVRSVVELSPIEIDRKAMQYAKKNMIVTCMNYRSEAVSDERSVSIDAYFKSSTGVQVGI